MVKVVRDFTYAPYNDDTGTPEQQMYGSCVWQLWPNGTCRDIEQNHLLQSASVDGWIRDPIDVRAGDKIGICIVLDEHPVLPEQSCQ